MRAAPQGWKSECQQTDTCLQDLRKYKFQVVFLSDDIYSDSKALAPELLEHFKVPKVLLSEVYRKSNGFFDSEAEHDEDGRLVAFCSWHRILVKIVSEKYAKKYKWHEMTFFTRWDPEHSVVFCIGAGSEFEQIFHETLGRMWTDLPSASPWTIQLPILEAVIELQDRGVWLIRDVVRNVEKDRSRSTRAHDDFVRLHEAARHTSHCIETLSVSIQTISALQHEILEVSPNAQQDQSIHRATKKVQKHVAAQLRMMRNLLARSQSNRDRLQNEIAFAYNMIAQRDSRTMTRLGEAARLDGRAMRTIAVVTMAFLPPTFLSAIFSMSFFNFQPGQDGGEGEWKVSDKFWVYFAFAIPLTCFTLMVWFWRQRFSGKARSPLGIGDMSDPAVYTIGWICAIATEYVAAQAFLDEEYDDGPDNVAANDSNDYTLGRIGKHNVVIAVLPEGEYGTASAATVAAGILHSFPNVRIGLMVGIGGGAPSAKYDIRLGDIVVSVSGNDKGGVFQYDFGKTIQEQQFKTTGFLNQPPTVLRTAVSGLRAQYERKGHRLQEIIDQALEDNPKLRKNYGKPSKKTDRLYLSSVIHPSDTEEACSTSCGQDPHRLVYRSDRAEDDDDPTIHYGLIASANQLMKDAVVRDWLAKEYGILCFEMEAAGLMNNFPCLVIRGICDYSDTHKNEDWQRYAAMVAAAYAKALLSRIHPNKIEMERKLSDAVSHLKDVAVEQRDLAQEYLKIAQHTVQERLSDRQWKCLQLFRLTRVDKDATYESYKGRVEDRVEGTCEWVLQHDNFRAWLDNDTGPLLITADPGCGKSVLAKYLVENVLPKASTVCYFFFKEQDQNTVRQALCALLHQLFYAKPVLIKHAMDRFDIEGNSLISSTSSLWSILSDIVEDPGAGSIIIVLDALDECVGSELKDMIRNLEKQCRRSPASNGKLKCLMTTRPYEEILSAFRNHFDDSSRIRIPGEDESEAISQEVNLVIVHRVDRLAKEKQLSSESKKELAQRLMEVQYRTYLWVYLVFDFLQCRRLRNTKKGIASAMQVLPTNVNAAYEQILSKSKDDRMVRRALAIILAAWRPLTLAEMNVAMSLDSTAQRFDDLDLETEKDFLTSLRDCLSTTWLLSYFEGEEYGFEENPGFTTTLQVVAYFGVTAVVESLLSNTVDLEKTDMTRQLTPLLWAIEMHDTKIAEMLLSSGANPNAQAADLGSALSYAACYCDEAMVKLLLDKGANVNAEIPRHGSALGATASSYEERSDFVEILLDRGADIDAHVDRYGTALGAAASRGNKDTVELLLKRGANVNKQGGIYGCALGAATLVQTLTHRVDVMAPH
ncbi:hypothetical protein N0V86_004272 [Didymella sp. IMI 355093]|nr:hypothetical protein N0V86_004272 [Didymella sp. IMI 355093]